MGNQILCCKQKWSKLDESEEIWLDDYDLISSYQYCHPATSDYPITSPDGLRHQHGQVNLVESSPTQPAHKAKIITQHISEREPEEQPFQLHTRWSSCSTVYIGSGCLFNPDKEATMRSVAVAIRLLLHYQKKHAAVEHIFDDRGMPTPKLGVRSAETERLYKDVYLPFDERRYSIKCMSPVVTSGVTNEVNAEVEQIYGFIKVLFRNTLFGTECAIVALILMERLVISAEVDIFSWSWRRQVLACVLMAGKVLDDQAVWNMDYCSILHGTSVDDLNALERHMLALLQFNIDVPLPVYARYFFDLHCLGGICGVPDGLENRQRLTPELALQMQLIPTHINTTATRMSSVGTGRSSVECSSHGVFDLPCTPKQRLRTSSLPTLHLSTRPSALNTECHLTVNSLKQRQQLPYASDPDDQLPASRKCSSGDREAPTPQARLPKHTDQALQCLRSNTQYSPSAVTEDMGVSPVSYDPLVVDDETALINSCVNTPPVRVDSKYRSCRFYPKSLSPHYNFYQRHYKSGNVLAHTADAYHQWHSTGSDANGEREIAPVTPSRATEEASPMNQVIRAVMGGGRTVTYSLLRDAGLF